MKFNHGELPPEGLEETTNELFSENIFESFLEGLEEDARLEAFERAQAEFTEMYEPMTQEEFAEHMESVREITKIDLED